MGGEMGENLIWKFKPHALYVKNDHMKKMNFVEKFYEQMTCKHHVIIK